MLLRLLLSLRYAPWLVDFAVHGVQDLANATGEGGPSDRVRSGGFSATSEAQNVFLSDTAVTESVAALGEPCCVEKLTFLQKSCFSNPFISALELHPRFSDKLLELESGNVAVLAVLKSLPLLT